MSSGQAVASVLCRPLRARKSDLAADTPGRDQPRRAAWALIGHEEHRQQGLPIDPLKNARIPFERSLVHGEHDVCR